jgi:DNA-binding CsgD family transcriptional regulator
MLELIKGINFTPKEIDVLACITKGCRSKKIAIILDVSTRTIEGHIANIFQKTSLHSQEHVRDFIEKSSALSEIKNHYGYLLTLVHLKEELQKLSHHIYQNQIT